MNENRRLVPQPASEYPDRAGLAISVSGLKIGDRVRGTTTGGTVWRAGARIVWVTSSTPMHRLASSAHGSALRRHDRTDDGSSPRRARRFGDHKCFFVQRTPSTPRKALGSGVVAPSNRRAAVGAENKLLQHQGDGIPSSPADRVQLRFLGVQPACVTQAAEVAGTAGAAPDLDGRVGGRR